MSFDQSNRWNDEHVIKVSIPLEQGNVFRHRKNGRIKAFLVSIPLEQGNVFRRKSVARK